MSHHDLLCLAGNDYHRLRRHLRVLEAFGSAVLQHGLGMSASRATTGDHPLYRELEEKLADFLGAEAVAVVGSGYMASLAAVSACASGAKRVVLAEMAHPSLVDAARASGVEVDRLVTAPAASDLVLTDAVSANTGLLADTARLSQECDHIGATLILDDAHGAGVLGDRGQGSPCSGLTVRVGTLSKAFGVFGGWVAGPTEIIEKVRRSSVYVASTPFLLPVASAALVGLDVVAQEARVPVLQQLVRRVKSALDATRWKQPAGDSPILSFAPEDQATRDALHSSLLAHGIEPTFIEYPGCPPGGHFRLTLHSRLSQGDSERLLQAITHALP